MGACNIEFTLKGKKSQSEIYDAFKKQQDQDRLENGRRDGYSGDFQTVHKIDYRLSNVFTSYSEAHDYCLKHASKWESVVAVYFCNGKIESKTLAKLGETLKALRTQLADLERTPLARSRDFQTCGACKSRLALKAFHGASCPVCRADLRPKALQNKIASLKAKIIQVESKHADKLKAERQKQIAKSSQIETMVAGWGAC